MADLKEITEAEMRIMKRIACGDSEKEIAFKLNLSKATVHNHAYRIRKKLNARSAVDVCRIFILSLENPKKFFLTAMFLLIHSSLVFSYDTIDMRRPSRTLNRTTRTIRNNN